VTVALDVLRDSADDDPYRTPTSFETSATSAKIRQAIASLPTREQTVLNLYYGIKDDKRNLVQIAAIMNMSPERVRQIKLSGEKQLRTTLVKSHAVCSSNDVY
jgi:RNA polymerase sigma factor (sigma-70 family)